MIPARTYARDLRAQGYVLQAIADEIGVGLSTAWRWCIGVPSDAVVARRRATRVRRQMPAPQRAKIAASMRVAWGKRRRNLERVGSEWRSTRVSRERVA